MTPNTRKPNESFKSYKERLIIDTKNKQRKNYVSLWDSSVEPKTYIRAKHGELLW